ncbi:MAG: hypothetical protein J6R94_02920 [Agathobacter sp.]|nr:hypothetical protein [Agathobacter sp.]
MKSESLIRVYRIYCILLGIVIIFAGLCLMAGCINIYFLGDQPFSREIVAETFSGIALPVYLCLAMTILGFIFDLYLSLSGLRTDTKDKMFRPYAFMHQRLADTKDVLQAGPEVLAQITKMRKNRKMHSTIRTIVILLAFGLFLVYALNGANYHQSDINSSMIKAMLVMLPALAISFGYGLFVAIHNESSMRKEIDLLKTLPSLSKDDASTQLTEETDRMEERKLNHYRLVILFVAVFFLIYGFIAGGTADVLTKAINICTECIGLG